jgi:hypothetical protein
VKNKEEIRKVAIHAVSCPNIINIGSSNIEKKIHGESELVHCNNDFFSLFLARHILSRLIPHEHLLTSIQHNLFA